ncbi:MBL fold metallo-hydrolase [Brucepastera parasyntrophica]|uniref:MBL fold metallo-hydrolase n=1 Tax=Brucepastera parasyntrophica TaxID=2880008 RepID=UPI00210D2731|nr:MBL fold metallo-hydrolase [Brucepastera parasyntrophica]ULQ60823.1 MBL fold metallo-hydrolase [Brucepastera parasyntrophica]
MLILQMELEILGSGTSHGVPVIGCDCAVCTSRDPRDNRMRASAVIRHTDGRTILIDAGPEFRIQALRSHISRLDAVLITHSHADHIHGIDDLRIFSHKTDMPIYADAVCLNDIHDRFSYVFSESQEGGGKPHLKLCEVIHGQAIQIAGTDVLPVLVFHGGLPITGWRIGDTAYITDCSEIPDASVSQLRGIKNLIIDAIRERPHSTHFNFSQALEQIERIGPERAWFTHITHDFSHTGIQEWLQIHAPGKKIEPAWDGLIIPVHE